jgi:hypothetical protein
VNPLANCGPVTAKSVNCSAPTATMVVKVKMATMMMELFSTNWYRPRISRTAVIAPIKTARIETGTATPPSFRAVAVPPTIPATWGTRHKYIPSQIQRTHETTMRGPGSVLSASRVVRPRVMA